jgi:hypothetical protein
MKAFDLGKKHEDQRSPKKKEGRSSGRKIEKEQSRASSKPTLFFHFA